MMDFERMRSGLRFASFESVNFKFIRYQNFNETASAVVASVEVPLAAIPSSMSAVEGL
jgi:hypothetical protein